jgi:hypothetical protein
MAPESYALSVGRVGWSLLAALTVAFVTAATAVVWRPDKWAPVEFLVFAGL